MVTSPQKRLLAEMDIGRREEERESAVSGRGPDSQALVQKLRAGELTRDRVELLSYLGYEPAQELIPVNPPTDLKDFIKGLALYDNSIMLRTATIAARAALPVFEAERPDDDRPRKAIEAAEVVVHTASNALDAATATNPSWAAARNAASFPNVHAAAASAASAAWAASNTSRQNAYCLYAVSDADNAGVKNIRELIQQELIKWVLNDK